MQLNNKFLKGVRSARSFWISIIAILFGLFFVGIGIYFYISNSAKTYEVATATITASVPEELGEDTIYHITLTYTDKNSVEHSGVTMDTYDDTWVVGKVVEIKYNVDDPNEVMTNTPTIVFPLIAVGLGSISAVVGIVVFIKTIKQLKRKPKKDGENAKYIESDFAKNIVKNTKLFFHYTGKMNQSYAVEDEQGNVLFECKLLKFNPFASNLYEFVDHKTGDKKQMKIGKTVTSESSGGYIFVGDVLSSRFKIDGVNCWDYVADRGYEIKHMLEGKTVINYQILKGNNIVAKIFPADAKNPFNENSKNFLRMNKGYYRLEIEDANLPDIVMIAFIVGRTSIVE